MAIFTYEALTSGGRAMAGTLEAPSREHAVQMLSEMELSVNSIEQAKAPRPRSRIGRNEFIMFNQQLASITRAGIPLDKGLRQLAKDVESNSIRRLIEEMCDDLEAGVDVATAFEKRKDMFPPLYGQIIKAGVTSGRLSEMLTSLNRHLEMGNQTRRIVFEAISYPLVVLSLAAIILSFLFVFLVPQFRAIFADMGSQLPGVTVALLSIPELVVPFWIAFGIIMAGTILLFSVLSTFPGGRLFKESIYMRIPVLGRVYHCSLLSKLSDSMAVLVGAGIDMPNCLRLGAGVTGSQTLIRECEAVARQVEQGDNIVAAGQMCKTIPQLFMYSVQLGYQRNELQDNLYSLADMYTEQTRVSQSRLQTLFLPIMLIFVGGIIAFAIMALFMPMVKLLDDVSTF